MHKNHLKNLFQLEGYILDHIEYKNNKTFLYCHVQKSSMTHYGERSLRVNETRERRLSHMMLEDKTVTLVVTQRRFYFPKHRTKRWERLPDVGIRKQTTNTFRLNTLRELQRDNYSGTGNKRNKSHMYPAHILDSMDFKVKWNDEIKKIGMDGKGVGRNKVVHNIVNLDKNKPLIVLPNLSQKHVKNNLNKIPIELRRSVKEVCIDMDTFYFGIAKECFPEARVVIDHFHVIQWALKLTDELRSVLQSIHKKKFKIAQIIRKPTYELEKEEWEKLNECFNYFPDLKRAWLIAQEVRQIYKKKNWKKACSQLRKTIWYCKQSKIEEMQTLAKTLKRWKEEILNYYLSGTTNAYTEGLHNRFETMRRHHCGIRNVERFAKRLIFCLLPFSVIAQQFFAQSCS